jgi:hypothetical protein
MAAVPGRKTVKLVLTPSSLQLDAFRHLRNHNFVPPKNLPSMIAPPAVSVTDLNQMESDSRDKVGAGHGKMASGHAGAAAP